MKDRRFWHNTLYKSINIYRAPDLDLSGVHAIDNKVWLERAQRNWNRWGNQGKDFIKGAVRYMEDTNYNLALFCLHQAAESSLIGIITAVLGYRTNGHSLARKIKMTLLFTDEIKDVLELDTVEGVRLFTVLQSGYAEARYNSAFKADQESVMLLKEMVDLLLDTIEQIYQQFIKSKTAS